MSEQIDWSKAPEDATHYHAATHGVFECWLKPGHAVRVSRREPDWREDEYADDLIATSAIKRPWSGEGLPPVGVVCEVNPDNAGWRKSVISYVGDGFIAWLQVGDLIVPEYGAFIDDCEFRPIRTPEQIAADERDNAVDEMHKLYMEGAKHSGGLYALYDAGYRKQ